MGIIDFTNGPRRYRVIGCLKSRLRVTDHRRVMPIAINTDKLYDTDLTDAAWADRADVTGSPTRRAAGNIGAISHARMICYPQTTF